MPRLVIKPLTDVAIRPGNVPATQGALGVLRRRLAVLRLAFPRARFLVRLDGGFATPEIFDVLDAEPGLDYVVAMAKNSVLVRHAAVAMATARARARRAARPSMSTPMSGMRRHVGSCAPRRHQS